MPPFSNIHYFLTAIPVSESHALSGLKKASSLFPVKATLVY